MKRLCHNTWEREERRLGWEQEEEEEEEGDRGGKRRPVGGWESYLFTLHFTTVHVQTPERICRARSRLRRCNVSVIRVQPLEEPERWGGNSGVTGRRAREGGEKKRCGGEKKKKRGGQIERVVAVRGAHKEPSLIHFNSRGTMLQ